MEKPVAGAFHATNGWFFRRLEAGSVRIEVEHRDGDRAWLDPVQEFDAATWTSIIAHVSGAKDLGKAVDDATRLHLTGDA